MPFGLASLKKLGTCDARLQYLCAEVAKGWDNEKNSCTVIYGYRGQEEQDAAFAKGWSKLKYPSSKHNSLPSLAVDLVPCIEAAVTWDTHQAYYFSGYVMATADRLGIKIRTGADWDFDRNVNDQDFVDILHFELV